MAAALVDFLIAFTLLIVLMVIYGIRPGFAILLVPLVMALAFMAAVGVGSLLAALNVAYRDFRYTIPFLVQIWMFATPTIYMNVDAHEASSTQVQAASADQGLHASERIAEGPAKPSRDGRAAVPGWIKHVLRLNPMTGLIGFFRAAVLGGPLPWSWLGASAASIGIAFIVGLMYFRRVESSFADII